MKNVTVNKYDLMYGECDDHAEQVVSCVAVDLATATTYLLNRYIKMVAEAGMDNPTEEVMQEWKDGTVFIQEVE